MTKYNEVIGIKTMAFILFRTQILTLFGSDYTTLEVKRTLLIYIFEDTRSFTFAQVLTKPSLRESFSLALSIQVECKPSS